jgi:two-component system, NarL family, sensor kinase
MEIPTSVEELKKIVELLIADRWRSAGALREIQRFAQGLLEVSDQERKDVAHQLIENTVQSLAAIKISLSLAKDSIAVLAPELQTALTDAVALLDLSMSEIETMSCILYPPLLEDFGLPEALNWHIKGYMQSSGIHTVLDMPCDLGRLSTEHELALFRIMQEGLIAVRRYSGNQTAKVHLYRNATEVSIEVSAAEGTNWEQEESSSAGAAAIRERVRHLGGRLEIVSGPRATTVLATLPLAAPHE